MGNGINKPLAAAVLAKILNDPEHFDQGHWVTLPTEVALEGRRTKDPGGPVGIKFDCGTSACVAGHTVALGGNEIDATSILWNESLRGYTASRCLLPDGSSQAIRDRAADLLGIKAGTELASQLFSGDTKRKDVVKALTKLIADKSQVTVAWWLEERG
jgi:hypothetical protein